MALHVYRSNRVEHLVDALGEVLGALWRGPQTDPLARVPVVVGSRGMDRWLRHELATRFGVAAGLVFPFPRQAYSDAATWLLSPRAPWPPAFAPERGPGRAWEPDPLAFRALVALRARAGQVDFAQVDRYLADEPCRDGAPVGRRELGLAREVADVLDGLMHEHPELALAWARAPDRAPPRHRWLAHLLADLGVAQGGPSPSPPLLLERVRVLPAGRDDGPSTAPTLAVFGLSTLGPGDRARLHALSGGMDLHLFLLAPAEGYWGEVGRQGAAAGLDNPVLAQLGGPSRDLLDWVADLAQGEHNLPFALADGDGAPASLLHRLQGWITRSEPVPAEPWPREEGDSSLAFHAACGALRQCEILRDELLRALAADPTLDARDVVVMTPQVEVFAPLLAAVLGRAGIAVGDGVEQDRGSPPSPVTPAIPTAVSDLGLRETNPVAAALLAVLDLAGERLSASSLSDLLELPAVCRRLGLAPEEGAALRELLLRGGLRWGEGPGEREDNGYPADAHHTLRFAAERAVLGALVGDPDGPPLVSGGEGPTVEPLPLWGREDQDLAGTLAAFARVISQVRARLAEARSAPAWREALVWALDQVAAPDDGGAWQRDEVIEVLDDWAAAAGGDVSFTREAVAAWLAGRFEHPARGDRPITGAVTVCALEPMRSVPFRIVALVGMDDGLFPRQTRRPAWDPLADPQLGLPAPDRREADRHLLLEAILSARERLWILWTGRDVHTFERVPAAVPVESLVDTVAECVGRPRDDLVQEHPLQPWSPRAFEEGPVYDSALERAALACAAGGRVRGEWAEGERSDGARAEGERADGVRAEGERAAGVRAEGEGGPRSGRHARQASSEQACAAAGRGSAERSWYVGEVLPPEDHPPRTLSLRDVIQAAYRPWQVLLRRRLGVFDEDQALDPEDRLPQGVELDWDDHRALLDRAVGALEAGDDDLGRLIGDAARRLRAQGKVPPGPRGEAAARAAVEDLVGLAPRLAQRLGDPVAPLPVHVPLEEDGGCALVDEVADVGREGEELRLVLAQTTADPTPHALLSAWVRGLALVASGHPVIEALVVTPAKTATLVLPEEQTKAAERVRDLGCVAISARRGLLQLFPRTSPELARRLAKGEEDPAALAELANEKFFTGFGKTDVEDPHIADLYRGYDPTAQIREHGAAAPICELARIVWEPLWQAKKGGRR